MTILALDFGGTQIKSGLIDDNFNVIQHFEALKSPDNLQACFDIIDQLVQPVLADISGIALSCPGTVDTDSGIIYNGGALVFLHEFKAKEVLEAKYGKPVTVLNDGKAAVLAELATGNLQGVKNGLALVLGTGLGGGIVINGQLYQGSNFQAGELSFILPVQKESMAIKHIAAVKTSAVAMIAACAEILGLEDKKDGRKVFEYINQKDNRVYPIFQDYCRNIGIYIANLQAVLDVDRVVIGGGISSQPILLQEIEAQIAQLQSEEALVFAVVKKPDLLPCKHKNDANLIGAAYFGKQ